MSTSQLLGRLRRCGVCEISFCLCQACDRGHWYCSRSCSQAARKLSRRRAAKSYRASEIGREKHAVAQRRYRQKRRRASTSEIYQSSAISEPSLDPAPSLADGGLKIDAQCAGTTARRMSQCQFCRRAVDAFMDFKRYPRLFGKSHKTKVKHYDHPRNTS